MLCVRRKLGYVFSFFGIVDFLAILPTYLQVLNLGWKHAAVVRSLRLLRVFRIFKLAQYLTEAQVLTHALRQSGRKILLFLGTASDRGHARHRSRSMRSNVARYVSNTDRSASRALPVCWIAWVTFSKKPLSSRI